MDSPIKDVSDTAYWIAYHRAKESERTDALFHDPLAARLSGERGRRISETMPTSAVVGWTVVLRTRIIDDFITFAIGRGIDTVLSLGAGLDARPYRMQLPASLRWIEADYPRLIEYKENRLRAFTPHCRLERVRIDLAGRTARQELLTRVNSDAHAVLVLTEGVVPYLTNDDVVSLAQDLRAMSHARYWIVDYFSERALKYQRRRRVNRAMQNAPFRFAPEDWFGFFRNHGWRVAQVRYFAEEAQRFGRPIPLKGGQKLQWAISQLWPSRARRDAMRKFAGYALLEPISGT